MYALYMQWYAGVEAGQACQPLQIHRHMHRMSFTYIRTYVHSATNGKLHKYTDVTSVEVPGVEVSVTHTYIDVLIL